MSLDFIEKNILIWKMHKKKLII